MGLQILNIDVNWEPEGMGLNYFVGIYRTKPLGQNFLCARQNIVLRLLKVSPSKVFCVTRYVPALCHVHILYLV